MSPENCYLLPSPYLGGGRRGREEGGREGGRAGRERGREGEREGGREGERGKIALEWWTRYSKTRNISLTCFNAT